MGPGHTMLGHAALRDLFSDFSFFLCFCWVFFFSTCALVKECDEWDSQAARVTVDYHHHEHPPP